MESKKKVIVFGLGQIYKSFINVVDESKVDIIALSDNNADLQGTYINGKKVIQPDQIAKLDFDYVIIACSYYDNIKNQLTEYKIREEYILNFYEIYVKMKQNDNRLLQLLKGWIVLIKNEDNFGERLLAIQEKNLFLNARNFINAVCNKRIDSLAEVEFQVYSQFGEDGIIQWLIHNVKIDEKTFIEFGVEDYTEANTRFLLMNDNWTGFVIDGSEENINCLKNWKYIWKYDLLAKTAFITKDNINQLIIDAGFAGDIGILSIDLDGNDYWILNAIDCVQPRILICEYNSVYGDKEAVSVPYDEAFVRTEKHFSNLYWGASLGAFCYWAEKNGYYYVGSNSAGNNAFFVRKDCISADIIPVNVHVFTPSKYRESRGQDGKLTYLRGDERLKCIRETELVDLKTNRIDTITNIYHL